MRERFLSLLGAAQGQSEFVVVAVVDIRGFSDFSRRHESPNIAMFIKRFYVRLLEEYFSSATFVKPTGDGLLLIFPYDEVSLPSVCETVTTACFRCLQDFPSICKDDPMINFDVPKSVGFGIARGTACRLFSGDQVIDYSGHLLNLASRLNDLARPSGIVIDGNFGEALVSEAHRELLSARQVYIRGIAEEVPLKVLVQTDVVSVPDGNLVPIGVDTWRSLSQELSAKDVGRMASAFRSTFPAWPSRGRRVQVRFSRRKE
jgi:class 3 adenylate cyclase